MAYTSPFFEELPQSFPDPGRAIESRFLKAHQLAYAGQPREALREALPLLKSLSPYSKDYAKAAHASGVGFLRAGRNKWAKSLFERCVAFYRLAQDAPELSYALNNLALATKNLGLVSVSLVYLDEALSLVPISEYPEHHRRLLINKSICLLRIGKVNEALACLDAADSVPSEHREWYATVSLLNNRGIVSRLVADFDASRRAHTEALALAQENASSRQECLALEFLGELHHDMGDFQTASLYLQRAHQLAEAIAPHGDLMMEILRRRGDVYVGLGSLDDALLDLNRSLALSEARRDRRETALARRSLLLAKKPPSPDTFAHVLAELRNLGDQFEFMKTVYLILANWSVDLRKHVWLQDAVSTATHYLDNLGIEFWKKRFRDLVGHSREIVPVRRPPNPEPFFFLECRSPAFQDCLDAASTAARSEHPALLLGETGSGKEFVARLIHRQSSRHGKSLVAINCGGLPESLVDSELFGHARGTFTGAHEDKPGLFEAADGGTVFLDEVAELPLPAQVKLLRFLDSGEYRRVGETTSRRADVRVISATNRNLDELIASGDFRTDLLYRLKVFQVDVPPLRDRTEDILPLAHFFLEEESLSKTKLRFAGEVENALKAYAWPGNVRELRNVCRYLAARAWGRDEVVVEDLPDSLRHLADGKALSSFERQRLELEREQMIRALREADGRIVHAAKLLGIGRNTFAQRMRALGIDKDRFRR